MNNPVNWKKVAEIVSSQQLIEAIEGGEYIGFCTECGAEQDQIEPDAEYCECEGCGSKAVFGAEQLYIAIGG